MLLLFTASLTNMVYVPALISLGIFQGSENEPSDVIGVSNAITIWSSSSIISKHTTKRYHLYTLRCHRMSTDYTYLWKRSLILHKRSYKTSTRDLRRESHSTNHCKNHQRIVCSLYSYYKLSLVKALWDWRNYYQRTASKPSLLQFRKRNQTC